MLQIKSEITVALNTGSHVGTARNSQRSVLVHNVHKSLEFSAIYCDFQFGFVVESRAAFVGIKALFIGFRNLPDCNRNFGFFGFLNGEVRACFTALEQQLIAMNPRCSNRLGSGGSDNAIMPIKKLFTVGVVKG